MNSGVVLVTGATGFIGSHLVDFLNKQNRAVRCLVRTTSDITFLKQLKVKIVYGDLLDKESLRKAVSGVEIVYHLAAMVRPHKVFSKKGELERLYETVNAQGTQNIASACLKEGVAKFIHISSISAVGVGEDLTESSICKPVTAYGKSKLLSEEIIINLVESKNFPAVIIRPGQIYGERAYGMLNFFKLIKKDLLCIIGDGTNFLPVCYVADLVEGLYLAEDKASPGALYFIFEDNYTFKEYVKTIAQVLGNSWSEKYLPQKLAITCAKIKEIAESLIRLKICPFRMDLGVSGMKVASVSWQGSTEKAKKELGFKARTSLEKGMMLTLDWFTKNSLL